MVRIVVAGKNDCHGFTKCELLAELVRADNPNFTLEKKSCSPESWSQLVNSVCEKNRFTWAESPLVYRELADTGGRADLIGNYSDFAEYANLYYGKNLKMSSEIIKKITEENRASADEAEKRKERRVNDERPLRIAIFNADSKFAYQFCNFLIAENFHQEKLKNGLGISLIGETCEGLALELFDTADGKLKMVHCGRILDDVKIKEDELEFAVIFDKEEGDGTDGILGWLGKNKEHYVDIANSLKNHPRCKVLLSSVYPTVVAAILDSEGFKGTIIASASDLQNSIRAMIARESEGKISTNQVKNIKVFGSTSASEAFVDGNSIQLEDIDSSINGPSGFRRVLRPIIYKKQFLENFESEIASKKQGILARAKGLVETLKVCIDNDEEKILSLVQPTPDLPDEYAELDLSMRFFAVPGSFKQGKFEVSKMELQKEDREKIRKISAKLMLFETLIDTPAEERLDIFNEFYSKC